MIPNDEWDAAVAEQPEYSRARARLAGPDDQVAAPDVGSAGISQIAAIAAGFDLRQHAQDLERQVEALTANAADLHRQRDHYRDSLRRILGVTRPDGEALIALVERRLGDVERLCVISEEHGKVTDRVHDLADEYAGSAPTARPLENLTRMLSRLSDTCTILEGHLDIQRTDPDEPLDERMTRIGLVVIEVIDARRRADNRSKRWQARARSAEAQRGDAWRAVAMNAERTIARLTEERDGLTLRLGKRVKRQVQRRGKRKGGR